MRLLMSLASSSLFWAPTFAAVGSTPAGLADVCNTAYIQSVLPRGSDLLPGISTASVSVTANAVTNYSVAASSSYPGKGGLDFCNVTFSYSHAGLGDKVNLWFWLPSPAQFQGRFLATGGGGLAITSGQGALQGGIVFGAAAATTDGGFGSWRTDLGAVLLRANGTLNYEMLYSYAYTSIHEMAVLGKDLARRFYGYDNPPSGSGGGRRLYAYFQGCSEGGREGFSQAQRFGKLFDGVAAGAPAFRQAFLQVMHLFPPVVETTRGYFPPACELDRISADAVAACDGLDGRVDGVVGRTDLCRMRHDARTSIGKAYKCAASLGGGGPLGSLPGPAAEGTVTAQAADVANDIWRGMFDSRGKQVYISTQPTAAFGDASTHYNEATGKYEAAARGFGVQWVNLFLRQVGSDYLSLNNVTYDTLRGWIVEGMQKFANTVQTTWPDLADFRDGGGKLIHFHGEADPGIPAASSTLYLDAVRRTMYPDAGGFNESYAALSDWYRFFLVPGAGHCGPSQEQPGPYPHDVLQSLIDWVEKGINPARLNATVMGGPRRGEREQLCSFPLRPLWRDGGVMDCVYDQASIDSWTPRLDSIPVPVY